MKISHKALVLVATAAGLVATVITAQPPVAAAKRVVGEAAGTVAATSDTTARPATKANGISAPTEITIEREVFDYDGSGRRDPYKSLMTSSDIRPLLSDLRLTAVAFDPDGNNSVAILRDSFSKQQYRVRVGQQLGRLRVAGIRQKTVQFTIEEFGFNRQETLTLSSDTTKVRNP